MKQILFRLTDEEYIRSEAIAFSKGFDSVNQYSKYLALDVDVKFKNIEVKKEAAKHVYTYLYPHEIEMLERNARLHGMSLSREIAIRLRQSCLKNEVCLYPGEVSEIRKLKTEVNSIGRNIHYIISGQRFCTINDPELMKEVRELIIKCNDIKKTFESLIDSVPNRFG